MQRNIRNELVVALFAAVSLLFAALFAILLSTSTQNPPLPATPTDLLPSVTSADETPITLATVAGAIAVSPTRIEAVTDAATSEVSETTAATATSARRESDEFTPSPSKAIAAATVDTMGTTEAELTSTPILTESATPVPATTEEVVTVAATLTSASRETEQLASETFVSPTSELAATRADDLTAAPSLSATATPVLAATDGSQMATVEVARTAAASTSARRDTVTLTSSATGSVIAVDSTALPADEPTAAPTLSVIATAILAATEEAARTAVATASARRGTATLTPSATSSVIAVDSTALPADEPTATITSTATLSAIPEATVEVSITETATTAERETTRLSQTDGATSTGPVAPTSVSTAETTPATLASTGAALSATNEARATATQRADALSTQRSAETTVIAQLTLSSIEATATAVTQAATESAVIGADRTPSTSGTRVERVAPVSETQVPAIVDAARATATVSREPSDDALAFTSTPSEALVLVKPETLGDLFQVHRFERTVRLIATLAQRIGPPPKPASVGQTGLANETPAHGLSATSTRISSMTPASTAESEAANLETIGDDEVTETVVHDAEGVSVATDDATPATAPTIDSTEITFDPTVVSTDDSLESTKDAQTTETQSSLEPATRSTSAAGTAVPTLRPTDSPTKVTDKPVIAVDSTDLPLDEPTASPTIGATATEISAATVEVATIAAAITSARRDTVTLTSSATGSVIAVDSTDLPLDEPTAVPSPTESAIPVTSATDGSQLATVEAARTAVATASARRGTATLTPSATSSVIAVDSTALPADEPTATITSTATLSAIPEATVEVSITETATTAERETTRLSQTDGATSTGPVAPTSVSTAETTPATLASTGAALSATNEARATATQRADALSTLRTADATVIAQLTLSSIEATATAVTQAATESAVIGADRTPSTSGTRVERVAPVSETQVPAIVDAARATATVSREPSDDALAFTSTPSEALVLVKPETLGDLFQVHRFERTVRLIATLAQRIGPPPKPASVGQTGLANETPAHGLSATSAEISRMTPASTVESEAADLETIGDDEVTETVVHDAEGVSVATDDATPATAPTTDSTEITFDPTVVSTDDSLESTKDAQTTETQSSLEPATRSTSAAGTAAPTLRPTDSLAKVTDKPATLPAARETDETPATTETLTASETALLLLSATVEDAGTKDMPTVEHGISVSSPLPQSRFTPTPTAVADTIVAVTASTASPIPTLSDAEIAEAGRVGEASATESTDAVVASTATATSRETLTLSTRAPTDSAATEQPTSPTTDGSATETSETVVGVVTPIEQPGQAERQTVTATATDSARHTEDVSKFLSETATMRAFSATTEAAEAAISTLEATAGDKSEELPRTVQFMETLTHTAVSPTSAQEPPSTDTAATATSHATHTRAAPVEARISTTDAATTALPAVFAHLIATPTAYGVSDDGVEGVCTVAAGWHPYEVQEGDTLLALAMASGSSLVELRDGNCFSPISGIFVGETVVVAQLPEAPLTVSKPEFTVAEEALDVVGCDSAQAKILLPEPMSELSGVFAVQGSALIPAGGSYRISVRPSWSDDFHTFLEVDMSVNENVIGLINSEIFGPGLQWLQLTLLDGRGKVVEGSLCEIPVVFTAP